MSRDTSGDAESRKVDAPKQCPKWANRKERNLWLTKFTIRQRAAVVHRPLSSQSATLLLIQVSSLVLHSMSQPSKSTSSFLNPVRSSRQSKSSCSKENPMSLLGSTAWKLTRERAELKLPSSLRLAHGKMP